ncbi:MAG TPA: DEAD/DEAH box helicase [Vicinamibacteria bacterium]|nr:DEAD/DEAH box helicase [Vicinamibacteria bacterium]
MTSFHPLVAEWFDGRFGRPTEPQLRGWPVIASGRDVLISAPTGSGKTLAAFLLAIDGLVKEAATSVLPDAVRVVYVSPLRALSNDVHKNLDVPLTGIRALAGQKGILLSPIRTAVRTGDTTTAERQKMLRTAPHVLVTTPESLFIVLTAARSRELLRSVETVIVDEIHALADDKRGAHLALSLERLDRLVMEASGKRPQRIGLSATVKPVEEVARFLSPDAEIVPIGHRRDMELSVVVPRDELGSVASNEMWAEIYDRLAELIQSHRTTLVFVNTRRLSERVAHHLEERLGEKAVLAHHGSLSRGVRLRAEDELKRGVIKAVVATASLELGIDVGTIDLVCQIGTPRSLSVFLQRVGRSGHFLSATPKGILFATTRDELVECAALVRGIRSGELDALEIPEAPLDVLAQQIVAAVAADDWGEEELYRAVRCAYPYRNLARGDFEAVVEMLSEGIASSRGRTAAYVHRDRVNGRLRGRRNARLTAITSGGAIPDNAAYFVVAEPEEKIVGTLDEDFAVESLAGDVFLLGTHSWRIRRVESGRVRVEDAHGAPPSIPFWRGEAPGRTIELSREVSELREAVAVSSGETREDRLRRLTESAGLCRLGAEELVEYVEAGERALGAVPSFTTVVIERFFDESGGMQLVVHAPFGSRINRAWGLALRKRFCRSFNLELQAAATDNGIIVSLSEQHAFPLEIVPAFVKTGTVEPVLTQALLAAPMFTARWRWSLGRSLAVPRFRGGKKVPPPIQRMRADDLLAAVFPDQAACAENLPGPIRIPDHPLVNETISDCLHEAMDLDGLKAILESIETGAIRCVVKESVVPSPFSHEIVNANPYAFLDDAPLEERRARAVQLRRTLDAGDASELGRLDPAAIALVEEEAWPLVRSADELHDALLTLVLVPETAEWGSWLEDLSSERRAARFRIGDAVFWLAAERRALVEKAIPQGELASELAWIPGTSVESEEAAAVSIVRGWLDSTGPRKASFFVEKLGLRDGLVQTALLTLEAEGQVLRGSFTGDSGGEVEWCQRRILARIHRLTLGRLRREIEPVSTADFMRFLLRWQHLSESSRLHGVEGLARLVDQLQGYEVPAAAWESFVLPMRLSDYRPEYLDQLCFSGEVAWGRLSKATSTRVSRVVPISLFFREDLDWLLGLRETNEGTEESLSRDAQHVRSILQGRGASFLSEIARYSERSVQEVETALRELVAHGDATGDGFDALRSLLNRERHRASRGRWSLLARDRSTVDDATERFAKQLLTRWGVVFRDLLARESLAPAWRDLLYAYRRLEARGEIRGGRFVSGYLGEQFALPEAIELLRALRREGRSGETLEVSAADPVNLTGFVLPGERLATLSSQTLRLVDGVPAEEPDSVLSAL